jgi:clan AA aspartic protease
VIGEVDDTLRALLTVLVASERDAPPQEIVAWVDTAFNGTLVIPRAEIVQLGLRKATTMEATLADGSTVELETYSCYLEWFGSRRRTQAIANDGMMPLLGTMLLASHVLAVDYKAKTLQLT